MAPSSLKSDPDALGVRRTLGCLRGVPGFPCPFHIAALHLAWLEAEVLSRGLTLAELPLFPAADWCTVSKTDMVATFEAAATMCGMPLVSDKGARLFGGHTLRITGARAYARIGLEVNKIRILARHSVDVILRYVADVPLQSMRIDLGLSAASHSAPPPDTRRVERQLARAFSHLSICEAAQSNLTNLVVNPPGVRFIQNVRSSIVHVVLPLGGERASCGWHLGASKTQLANVKTLINLVGVPWFLLCERCLFAERAVAKDAQAASVAPLSDSE